MSTQLSNLRLIESYLDDLRSLIEESDRIQSLGVSSEDNDYDLRKMLSKITKFLERNDDGWVKWGLALYDPWLTLLQWWLWRISWTISRVVKWGEDNWHKGLWICEKYVSFWFLKATGTIILIW